MRTPIAGNVTVTLREIAFTKQQLTQLTKPELELLLRLGLAVNELLLFQRFVGVITNSRPTATAAQDIWLSHLFSALMCVTGKVFEALELFRRHFLNVPLGRELRPLLPEEAQKAIETLKAIGGKNSVLSKVRNLYSFHFHNDKDLSPYLDHLAGDARLSIYYGLCDANTVNHFAVESFVTSLMQTTGASNGEQAIVRIIAEIQPASRAFHTFVMAVEENFLKKIGPVNFHQHQVEPPDVGIIDEQRFPSLLTPSLPPGA